MSKGSRDRTKDRDKFDVNFEKIFSKKKGNKERKKQMSHNNIKPDCAKIIQKRMCNGKMPNCTPTLRSPSLMRFRCLCACAVAHARTYAHPPLKGAWLQGCAVVRMCISIENYSERYIKIPSYFEEIGFSSRNIVRI